jgi:hypothetical protein
MYLSTYLGGSSDSLFGNHGKTGPETLTMYNNYRIYLLVVVGTILHSKYTLSAVAGRSKTMYLGTFCSRQAGKMC